MKVEETAVCERRGKDYNVVTVVVVITAEMYRNSLVDDATMGIYELKV